MTGAVIDFGAKYTHSPVAVIDFGSQYTHNPVAVIEFGAQYTQLIARRVREQSSNKPTDY